MLIILGFVVAIGIYVLCMWAGEKNALWIPAIVVTIWLIGKLLHA